MLLEADSPSLASFLLFAAFPLASHLLLRRSSPTPPRRRTSPDPPAWVRRFLETGVATVPVLSPSEADSWRSEVEDLMKSRSGVPDVAFTAPYDDADVRRARKISDGLSSTFGSGGVMDVHLSAFQDRVRGDVRVWKRVKEVRSTEMSCRGRRVYGYRRPSAQVGWVRSPSNR